MGTIKRLDPSPARDGMVLPLTAIEDGSLLIQEAHGRGYEGVCGGNIFTYCDNQSVTTGQQIGQSQSFWGLANPMSKASNYYASILRVIIVLSSFSSARFPAGGLAWSVCSKTPFGGGNFPRTAFQRVANNYIWSPTISDFSVVKSRMFPTSNISAVGTTTLVRPICASYYYDNVNLPDYTNSSLQTVFREDVDGEFVIAPGNWVGISTLTNDGSPGFIVQVSVTWEEFQL